MNTAVHGTVEINATDYPYSRETISIDEVRSLAQIPSDHRVYIEIPEPTDDPELLAGQIVDIHHHRKFYSVTPHLTGGAW